MGAPLKNPPVYFTVAQVRFNPLLKLIDFLPSIQEGLRKIGFPAFSSHNTVALQFAVQDGQTVPQPVPHEQYLFANVEQTHCFVLSANSLTFQSTDYGTYQRFSEAFLEGLALVHKEVELAFTDRVGLRYLDHVSPKEGDRLPLYLAPGVQGLSAQLGGDPVHAFSEALNTVGNVTLRARVVIRNGRLGFPPDLRPQGMAVQQRFLQAQGMHAILDTDGAVDGRALFSLDSVRQHLRSVHEVIGAAFKATVTEHAIAVWNEA